MDQAQKDKRDWAFLLPFFISGASVGAHKFPPFNTPKVIEKALPKQYIVKWSATSVKIYETCLLG